MDITPYKIGYSHGYKLHTAEVKPCCDKNNVVDYAIYINSRLAFNITRPDPLGKWIVSLKNVDNPVDDEMVQGIGTEIEKHNQRQIY